jgi:hypothetical protein
MRVLIQQQHTHIGFYTHNTHIYMLVCWTHLCHRVVGMSGYNRVRMRVLYILHIIHIIRLGFIHIYIHTYIHIYIYNIPVSYLH